MIKTKIRSILIDSGRNTDRGDSGEGVQTQIFQAWSAFHTQDLLGMRKTIPLRMDAVGSLLSWALWKNLLSPHKTWVSPLASCLKAGHSIWEASFNWTCYFLLSENPHFSSSSYLLRIYPNCPQDGGHREKHQVAHHPSLVQEGRGQLEEIHAASTMPDEAEQGCEGKLCSQEKSLKACSPLW